jgi:uncharacterized caspase-like protein
MAHVNCLRRLVLSVFVAFFAIQCFAIGLAYGQPQQAPERAKIQKRVALVIGNSSYAKEPLAFATNDAKDMAQALSELGFDVSLLVDATRRDMLLAISAFIPQAKSADVALFYFAGHGEQVVTTSDVAENFLLPVDVNPGIGEANISSSIAVMPEIVSKLATSTENRIGIVILDACRSRAATRSDALDVRLPSLFQGGLAKMSLPSGTFVAYGAAPGTYAFESPDSRHGRFTNSLLKHMRTPGLLLEQVFRRVRTDVERDSNMKQSPREETALRDNQDFYFVDPVIKSTGKRGQVVNLSALGSQNKALTARPSSGNRTETSDLITTIQRAPAVSKMRTLQQIVKSRAPEFTVDEVEAILKSFWTTARFTAFAAITDSLPKNMSLEAAGRVTAIALHVPNTMQQAQPKAVYEDLLQRGKINPSISFVDFDRVWREIDQKSGRCAAYDPPSIASSGSAVGNSRDNSNAKLLQIISATPEARRRDIVHDIFQNQNVELNAVETISLLRLFPPEIRAEILLEIRLAMPDLFSWDEVIEVVRLMPVSAGGPREARMPRRISLGNITYSGRADATLTPNQRQIVLELLQEEFVAMSAGARSSVPVQQNNPSFAAAMETARTQSREGLMRAMFDPMLAPFKPCE